MSRTGLSRLWLSLAIFSGVVSCGQNAQEHSSLSIRGGSNVSESDRSTIRRSTVALTTDIVKAGGDPSQSALAQGHSFCSGTIIGKRLVVTAAHCTQELIGRTEKGGPLLPKPSDWIISFDTQVSPNGRLIRAAQVIPHPDWNPAETLSPFPSKMPNDIGLIVLSEDIPEDMQIAAIADPNLKTKGLATQLAGFGVTKDRNTNDTGTLRTIASSFTAENGKIARITHGGWFKGICAGDSGGPAYVKVGEEYQLVGAASTGAEIPGIGCAGTNSNSTDVRYYKQWIEKLAL